MSFITALDSTEESTVLVVRGLDDQVYYRRYYEWNASWAEWRGVHSGETCDAPAAVFYEGHLYLVVRGIDGESLWYGSVELESHNFSGWMLLDGATRSAPVLTRNGPTFFLVVRGLDNYIYYRRYDLASGQWQVWIQVPAGSTSNGPAAMVFNGELHMVVRGFSNTIQFNNLTIWHATIDLQDESFEFPDSHSG